MSIKFAVDLSDYSKKIVDKFMKELEDSSSVKWRAREKPTDYSIDEDYPILCYENNNLTRCSRSYISGKEYTILTRKLFIERVSKEMPKAKELTVKEISKLLGYEIKVVK